MAKSRARPAVLDPVRGRRVRMPYCAAVGSKSLGLGWLVNYKFVRISWRRALSTAVKEFELGWRMPQEANLDAFRHAASVRPDPRLVRAEGNPDMPRPVALLVTSRPVTGKSPPVAGHERAAVADEGANRLKVPRP